MHIIMTEEAASATEEIIKAFHELHGRRPDLLSGFIVAFEERGNLAGSPETKGCLVA